ncbi:guanosine-3',5'-bis(diphosphate) 3'-pyrophosphohydrolase [Thiosulfatimonas sediminis]|uniref:guanosine-3',5'-bis(diphosphate) 3'-diphosphatase n=1 Tax=Thiosulfatimonas sediminis TaxID=2675054 RepID=A0A6F8PYG3_9GAMM|nr:bifunctional (p)ppGpp synthetase/guanosine-3',5'-bis(diphosphate) 3'-pyrophosphohydrolase [Thiosulfatimonas sediminis]BBP47087.1 guanosine-3',5'-bis(diphosphate) 3'-pyrophosphohydrolase [Thiosulfatimonas sediminis]
MPTPTSIDGLIEKTSAYLHPEQVERIRQAFEFGALAHQGQTRKAGGDYIWHPVAVAEILAEYKLDHESIIAAILHDVVEDTPFNKEDIIERFGESVADMVEGVTKLAKVQFASAKEAKAESFQKMMLAMSRDIRVILIKLADRLHNMRTMGAMRRDKQARIADETLEIYAPIAARLGINAIRIELEDLCFKAKHPYRYEVLKSRLQQVRGGRNEALKQIADTFQKRLDQDQIPAQVIGREKHLYSLYCKMQGKKFSEILDIFAFRIIVENIDSCYRTLGSVHSLYKPLPLRIKDYIAVPKKNGYQSLHTTVMGPYNNAHLEVQIRTEQMHDVSEHGIAAHWQYKQQGENSDQKLSQVDTLAQEWVKNLLEIQQSAGNSLDFLENVKIDLFPEVIYVFTPKGEIITLPRGSTALDFAYALHTDLGHATKGCRIDKKASPLRTVLESGQSIQIIKGRHPAPQPSWLQFVSTAKARTQIRHYMRQLKASDAIKLGERLLDNALKANQLTLNELSNEVQQYVIDELHLATWNGLLEEIGSGNRMPQLVAKQIQQFSGSGEETNDAHQDKTLPITGTEGMVIHYAQCCHPIPGDLILGFISREKGLVIHRECCANVKQLKSQPDKCIELHWAEQVEGTYFAELQLEVENRRGSLGTIASTIASTNTDIDRVHSDDKDDTYSLMNFVIKVRNRVHLAQVIRVLKSLPIVQKIQRN